MPNVDQFESLFKAASKPIYTHRPVEFTRVRMITDLTAAEARDLGARLREGLPALAPAGDWREVPAEETLTVEQLMAMVERDRPELIVTYRNVHSAAWQWPHSLGRHLDVLTQASDCPVLVIPHPRDGEALERAVAAPRCVLAATDHLAGDGSLVRFAAAFAPPGARLTLAHVEDDATFTRYMDVISKIPEIDTDIARETIHAQLLREPRDYVDACRIELDRAGLDLEVVGEVGSGHRVGEYRALVDRHGAGLLVMHTKDDEQLAMHGLAFPLAVELRDISLLMV